MARLMRLRLTRLCVAMVGAGVCTAALAEPVTAAIAVAVGVSTTTVVVAAQIALMVGSALYQRQRAKREARRARDAYNASLTDRNVTIVEPAPVVRHIYGRATVGGAVAHLATTGSNDQHKHVVVMWAGHECDAIEDIQIAGVSIEVNDQGWATVPKWSKQTVLTNTVAATLSAGGSTAVAEGVQSALVMLRVSDNAELNPSDFTVVAGVLQVNPVHVAGWAGQPVRITTQSSGISPQVRVRHHLGTDTQVADNRLILDTAGLSEGKWTSTDRLQGICYSVFILNLNNTDLQGGLPQITATIRGKRVLDPRSGATAWSDNPALCAYDLLRSADYGKGVMAEQVEGVVAAANACDEQIRVDTGSGIITAPRYRCNGAWLSDDDPDTVLEDVCRSMAGYAIPGGVWRLLAGVYTPPVMVLNDAMAAGSIAMVPAPGRADAWNGVRGQYIDPLQYNQAIDYEPHQVAAYVADDGGEVWGPLNLPFTDSGWRARTLASISLEQSRARSLVWLGPLACLRAQVGDRVSVTNALLGLAAVPFRVTARKYTHTTAGGVELSLTQDDPAFYATQGNVVANSPDVQPDLTERVSPPSGLVLTNPRPGVVRIAFAPSPDQYVVAGGRLLVEARLESGTEWVSLPSASGGATSQTITGLPVGLYVVQIDWQSVTGRTSGRWAAGVVRVAQSAYASLDDVSDAVASSAKADSPVFTGVVALPTYTLATLPAADGDHMHTAIVVTDASNGPSTCVSNGLAWISQITGLAVA